MVIILFKNLQCYIKSRLPVLLRWNNITCDDFIHIIVLNKILALAVAMGVADESMDIETQASKFTDGIDILCKACEIPTLEEYGIEKDKFFEVIDTKWLVMLWIVEVLQIILV